jgi:nucleoid-associated protein YgaU
MFTKGSRYEKSRVFVPDASGQVLFKGVRARDLGQATGVVEHVIQNGDRMDLLARNYYNNARLWWRILEANPDICFAGDLELRGLEGEILLIPKAKE